MSCGRIQQCSSNDSKAMQEIWELYSQAAALRVLSRLLTGIASRLLELSIVVAIRQPPSGLCRIGSRYMPVTLIAYLRDTMTT